MVFFTCNLCGESVKKPAVEKHYNTKCRGATKNVSCMDCLKDFRGEEYVAHTKCITEAQKYSGKDYVHKEAKNSGEKKQESWMDIIRAILDSNDYKLSEHARNAFQRLQSVDNVPRKKVKFQNFAKNCMKMPMRLSEEVWSILEKEQEKMKSVRQKENVTTNANVEDRISQNGVKRGTPEENRQEPAKKNSKEDKINGEKVNNLACENAETAKKKSMKNKANTDIEDSTNKNEKKRGTPEENGHEGPTKKKSKKDKTQNNGEMASSENAEPVKKSKKNKANEAEVLAVADTNRNDEPPKKKSKKAKTETEVVVDEFPTNAALGANGELGDEFEWSAVIEKIVRKSIEGIAVDKLKTRILKKYIAKLGIEDLTEKQQKKFEKKFSKNLKKSSCLQLEGEVVKAC